MQGAQGFQHFQNYIDVTEKGSFQSFFLKNRRQVASRASSKRCNFSRTEIALKLQVVCTRDLKLQSRVGATKIALKIATKIASKIARVNGP